MTPELRIQAELQWHTEMLEQLDKLLAETDRQAEDTHRLLTKPTHPTAETTTKGQPVSGARA